MTQKEKIEILRTVENRCYAELENCSGEVLFTQDLEQLIRNIRELKWMAATLEEEGIPKNPTEQKSEIQQTAAPVSDAKSDAVSDEAPAPAPTSEPEVAKMSDQELRGYFTAARKKGLNVSAFIKELGAGNLTELTAQQRITAVEKLKAGGYV